MMAQAAVGSLPANGRSRSIALFRRQLMTRLPALLAVLVLGGCAVATPEQAIRPVATVDGRTIDYRDFTTGPLMAADFRTITDWSSPDPQHVVLWNTPNRAYLVSLTGPCMALQDAATIGVTGSQLTRAGSDAIMVQGERCGIRRIERLDTYRLHQALGR